MKKYILKKELTDFSEIDNNLENYLTEQIGIMTEEDVVELLKQHSNLSLEMKQFPLIFNDHAEEAAFVADVLPNAIFHYENYFNNGVVSAPVTLNLDGSASDTNEYDYELDRYNVFYLTFTDHVLSGVSNEVPSGFVDYIQVNTHLILNSKMADTKNLEYYSIVPNEYYLWDSNFQERGVYINFACNPYASDLSKAIQFVFAGFDSTMSTDIIVRSDNLTNIRCVKWMSENQGDPIKGHLSTDFTKMSLGRINGSFIKI